jgi:hypothetical protein
VMATFPGLGKPFLPAMSFSPVGITRADYTDSPSISKLCVESKPQRSQREQTKIKRDRTRLLIGLSLERSNRNIIVKIHNGKFGFIEPMLALAVTKLREGPAWSYELKFDGYRAIGVKATGPVRLFSRNGKDSLDGLHRSRALEALPDGTVEMARSSRTTPMAGLRSTSCRTGAPSPICTSTPSTYRHSGASL